MIAQKIDIVYVHFLQFSTIADFLLDIINKCSIIHIEVKHMAVGSKLKQLIIESGYNQKQVAEMAGIKPQTLNNIIIRDSARTDIQNLIKICRALHIDISVFAEDALDEFYQDHPNIKKEDNIKLSSHENDVIRAYREKPALQPVIDKLLDVEYNRCSVSENKEKTVKMFKVARSSDGEKPQTVELTQEEYERLLKAVEMDDNEL